MSGRRGERQEWPADLGASENAASADSLEEAKEDSDRSSSRTAKSAPPRSKPRRILPPLKRDDEFVDLQSIIDKSAPVYEFTHGYMDAIILKCDKCKRHAKGRRATFFSVHVLVARLLSDGPVSFQSNGPCPVSISNLVQVIEGIRFVALSAMSASNTSNTPKKPGAPQVLPSFGPRAVVFRVAILAKSVTDAI